MSCMKQGVILLALCSVAVVGCESKAGSGAIIGGLGGAAAGAVIGHNSHGRTGAGAAIGAGVGALGGALVGHAMDKSDEKKRDDSSSSLSSRYRERDDEPTYNASTTSRITNLTVMDWTRQGVNDDIIVDRIQRSGQTFVVTAGDERDLRNAGVSDKVIRAMKDAR